MNRLREFFLYPCTGRNLAALRIVIGLAMLAEAISVFPYLDQLYGPQGYLQADLLEFLTGAAIPGMFARVGVAPAEFLSGFHLFYALFLASLVAFTLGFKTRAATVLVWVCQTALVNCGYFSSYGLDRYFQNFLFLLMFFPAGNVWSLDRVRARASASPLPAARAGWRLTQLFLLLAYLDAGISKSRGHDWWSGDALWKVLNQPEFRAHDFLWLAAVPWLPKLLGWGTVFIECTYCVGAWIPRVGRLWVMGIIGLHLGIALFMSLSLFGIAMAAINAAIFLV